MPKMCQITRGSFNLPRELRALRVSRKPMTIVFLFRRSTQGASIFVVGELTS